MTNRQTGSGATVAALVCLLLTVPASGQAPQVVLSQVRPEVVLIATGVDVVLVGTGFGATCGVWVRAADIPEQAVPAIVRSSTEAFVRLGSEWTGTPPRTPAPGAVHDHRRQRAPDGGQRVALPYGAFANVRGVGWEAGAACPRSPHGPADQPGPARQD